MRIPHGDSPPRFVPVEQVIARNVYALFRDMTIVSVHPFRVTRNADIARFEQEAEDLMAMIAEELRERRSAPVVRIEIDRRMPPFIRELLLHELELDPEDVVEVKGDLALSDTIEIAKLGLRGHTYEPRIPVVPPRLAYAEALGDKQDIFSVLRKGDILVHHPYESFNAAVQQLLDTAPTILTCSL